VPEKVHHGQVMVAELPHRQSIANGKEESKSGNTDYKEVKPIQFISEDSCQHQ
jgi:hypothetical protein